VVLPVEGGTRLLQAVTRGFPLAQKSEKAGKPIKPKRPTTSPTPPA